MEDLQKDASDPSLEIFIGKWESASWADRTPTGGEAAADIAATRNPRKNRKSKRCEVVLLVGTTE
jgi:hypothetical protein